MHHPDNRPEGGIERTILAEIYKEFWQVLDAIEKDKPLP
jgi:hypothetical protein